MSLLGPAVSVELVAAGLRAGTGPQRGFRGALGGEVRPPVQVVQVLDQRVLNRMVLNRAILDRVRILDRLRVPAALARGQHRLERILLPDDAGELRERIVPRRRTG
jgi:hypothetical protein